MPITPTVDNLLAIVMYLAASLQGDGTQDGQQYGCWRIGRSTGLTLFEIDILLPVRPG